jgi:hypothetical protein
VRSTTFLFTPRCTLVQVLGVNLGQSNLHCNISCQNARCRACHRIPCSKAPPRVAAAAPSYTHAEMGLRPAVRAPQPSGRASLPRGVPALAAGRAPRSPPVRPRPPPAHARLPRTAPYLRCNGLGILATKAWSHAPSPYCLFKGPPPLLAGSAPPPRHHGCRRRAFHPAHFQYRANPLGASPPSPRPTHATSCPGRAIFVAGAKPPRPPNRSAAARPRQ